MRKVTYSMGISLDGYITGPDGDITAPLIALDGGVVEAAGARCSGRSMYPSRRRPTIRRPSPAAGPRHRGRRRPAVRGGAALGR